MRNSDSLTPTWQIPIIIAIAVILVVLAAFLLTQIDAVQRRSLLPPKRLPVVDQEATAAAEEEGFVYLPADEIITATPSATPEVGSITPIDTPQATAVSDLVPSCNAVPEGWTPYIVKQGDTLSSLAFKYGVSKKAIVQANCLLYEQIIRGQVIYLPQDVNAHFDSTQCGVPEDWIHYVVHPGDTLLMLAEERNSSVYLIMKANCLESTTISPGRKLFLPPPHPTQIVPTKQLPSPTRPRPQVTITATWTRIFFPTATATVTILPSATGTVPIQTITATPTLPAPTQTPTPAPTNTGTPLPFTPTSTSVPPTQTPTLFPTATPTLIPSSTPTPFIPTATNTAPSLPPTSTDTPPPVVPTMTNTAAPLLPSSTSTPIPASPTATALPIPPTPTATVPVHPPSPPTATSPVSTDPA